jgi:hypothetical protein
MDQGAGGSVVNVFDEGWVNYCLSLIYARAHREREEELEHQLELLLRPVNVD